MAKFNSDTASAARRKFLDSKRNDGSATSGDGGQAFVDPVAAGQAAGDPGEPGGRAKRRDAPASGSPASGGTGKAGGKAQSASLDLSSAIGLIQGAHAVIGGLSRQPHWFVNDDDAKRYGQAMANAARHFPMKATQKAIDVSMLMIVAFSIEAPRIGISIQLARRGQPPQPRRPPAQVFQFVHPNQGSPNAPPPPATSPQPPMGEGAGAMPPVAEGPPDYSADIDAIGGEPAA
jgi:hypothetical protein